MDTKWLSDLEQKVKATVAQLKDLRKENRDLKARLKKLKQQADEGDGGGGSSEGWEAERTEICQRVEKLAASLEELL